MKMEVIKEYFKVEQGEELDFYRDRLHDNFLDTEEDLVDFSKYYVKGVVENEEIASQKLQEYLEELTSEEIFDFVSRRGLMYSYDIVEGDEKFSLQAYAYSPIDILKDIEDYGIKSFKDFLNFLKSKKRNRQNLQDFEIFSIKYPEKYKKRESKNKKYKMFS